MIALATFVTDFGDAGAVVPMCAAVALALLLLHRPGLALRWSVMTVAVWAGMLLLKLIGYVVVGEAVGPWTAVTPSGHVAAATASFAGLLALCGVGWPGVGLAAAAIAAAIAVTRVLLGDHTVLETMIGGGVGVTGAWAMAAMARGRALEPQARPTLLGAAMATLLLVHGAHVTWEPAIRTASAQIRSALTALR